jgi:OOP family OmpA-OmpF porin
MNRLPWIAAWLVPLVSGAAFAQVLPADAPGIQDHPAISRYAGSWLYGGHDRDFEEVSVPAGVDKTVRLEGKLTRRLYIAPAGKTLADVHRNYQVALERAGATAVYSCSGDCKLRDVKSLLGNQSTNDHKSAGKLEGFGTTLMLQLGIEDEGARYWYGTLKSASGPLHVVLYSGPPGVQVLQKNHVATLVAVIQPQALETGKVQVDAKAMAASLTAEGRVALYGLYFDSGRREVKPESSAQLGEMARLLQGDAKLKVYIVGHTDSQGTLDGNLALSRARAQAVIDALVREHKIDARRLAAAGVASYSPVASNASEAGRAKNRRVELVLQ